MKKLKIFQNWTLENDSNSRSRPYDKEVMRNILELVQEKKILKIETKSPRQAELLRFALYNFRRNQNLNRNFTITLSENTLIIHSEEAKNWLKEIEIKNPEP